MSQHEIPVIRIEEIKKHENADTLGIVQVFGWTVCVRLTDFKAGDLMAYIPPDYMVNTERPEFSFLKTEGRTKERIKVKKLRGIVSQGLPVAVPADSGLKEGDNAMEYFGIERYQPPEPFSTGGEDESAPSGLYAPKYDMENYNRYRELFISGEPVIATEKVHGCSSRYVYSSKDGRMHCSSHTSWKREDEKNVWWKALYKNPWIAEWCKQNPDILLYGEVFGQVQNLKYGAGKTDFFFAAFDILDHDKWVDFAEARDRTKNVAGFKWVPLAYQGPFDEAVLLAEAEKDSLWPNALHLREGIVVKPEKERTNPELGRVQLKIVSNRYFMQK